MGVTPAHRGLVLALSVAIAACMPPASVVAESPEPAHEADAEAESSAPRYARLHGTITLYADPSTTAQHIELEPDSQTPSDRVVELLEADVGEGWWRVRTLLPRQALALGLDGGAGLAVLSLEGWVEARQLIAFEPGPAGVGAQAPATRPAVAAADSVAVLEIRAGTVLRWPDGRGAGEVVEDHYFHTAPTLRDSDGPDGRMKLACHERRTAPGVGIVQGWLCVTGDDAAGIVAVNASVGVALDAPPRHAGEGDEVKGALDRDIIRRIVRAHINEVRSCYDDGLANDPQLAGRVSINFVISGSGSVSSALVQDSTVSDATVSACIAAAVETWKFPKPRGGGNVIVTYPFNLSPG
jgi:hypothetical protein